MESTKLILIFYHLPLSKQINFGMGAVSILLGLALLVIFPVIVNFFIIPKIENEIGKKNMYIEAFSPNFIFKSQRVILHIFLKNWIASNNNKKIFYITQWSKRIDNLYVDDLALYAPYKFSKFEIITSYLAVASMIICTISVFAGLVMDWVF